MTRNTGELIFRSFFIINCLDEDGDFLWREYTPNDVTTQGLNEILTDFFANGTQKPNWYCGLINNTGYKGIAPEDTMASHPNWTEYTGYTQATRPAYSSLAIAAGVIRNNQVMQFLFNESAVIRGIFITSSNVKGGTTGILWNRGIFFTPRTLSSGQTLQVSYLLRAGSSSA